jgi:Tol biopolymer transport system component
VVSLSTAQDTVPGMTGFRATPQVYLREIGQNENRLLSKDSGGTPSGQVTTTVGTANPRISGDGRWVVFTSQSFLTTNLLGGYVYLFDTLSNSLAPQKLERPLGVAPGESVFSGDGRYLAYVHADVLYIEDLTDGTKRFVTSNDGSLTNLAAVDLVLSRNGRFLVYRSATSVVSTNDIGWQVYAFDQQAGTNFLVGTRISGSPPTEPIIGYAVSDPGQVAFATVAPDLGSDGDPTGNDIFLQQIGDATSLRCASRPLPGLISRTANGRSWIPPNAVSVDGRYLVFTSESSDLVPNDTNGVRDLFVYDFVGKSNRIVSLTASGELRTRGSEFIGMSGDARKIAYFSHEAEDLASSIYVYDADKNVTTLESVLPDGERSAFVAYRAALSADGKSLAFVSGNQFYVRDVDSRKTEAVEIANPGMTPFLSASGKYVVGVRPGQPLRIFDRTTRRIWDSPFGTAAVNDQLTISPDESTLLFFTSRLGNRLPDLYAVSLVTKKTNWVASNVIPPAALSLDGAVAFFQTTGDSNAPNRIYAHDLATGIESPLPLDGSRNYDLAGSSVSMSDDARFFILGGRFFEPGMRNERRSSYVFDRVFTNLIALSPEIEAQGESVADAAFSADGRTIAFRSLAPNAIQADLNDGFDLFSMRLGIKDENANGIDDGWELQFAGIGKEDADPDGDGSLNRAEYLAGTNPTSAESAPRIIMVQRSGEEFLVQWNCVRGKHYQIEGSSDLGSRRWEALGTTIVATGPTTMANFPTEGLQFRFFRVILPAAQHD